MRFEPETRAKILSYLYTRNEMLGMIVYALKDHPIALGLDLPIPLPSKEEAVHNSPERKNYLQIVATRYPRFAKAFHGLPDEGEVLEEAIRLRQLPVKAMRRGGRQFVDEAVRRVHIHTSVVH